MTVKLNNRIHKLNNTISANQMEPLKFYVVEDAGDTIQSVGDLIATCHIGNGRNYITIGKTVWCQDYRASTMTTMRVREVDVEVDIIGYTK